MCSGRPGGKSIQTTFMAFLLAERRERFLLGFSHWSPLAELLLAVLIGLDPRLFKAFC